MSQALPPDKLTALLRRLLDQTRAGKVGWEDLSLISAYDEFRARVGSGMVRVAALSRADPDVQTRGEGYRVSLIDGNGLLSAETEIYEDDGGYALARDVFEAARAHARHGEILIDDMLRSLGN